jgi:hypothetical protein
MHLFVKAKILARQQLLDASLTAANSSVASMTSLSQQTNTLSIITSISSETNEKMQNSALDTISDIVNSASTVGLSDGMDIQVASIVSRFEMFSYHQQ